MQTYNTHVLTLTKKNVLLAIVDETNLHNDINRQMAGQVRHITTSLRMRTKFLSKKKAIHDALALTFNLPRQVFFYFHRELSVLTHVLLRTKGEELERQR